jgi:hypothetical protein
MPGSMDITPEQIRAAINRLAVNAALSSAPAL